MILFENKKKLLLFWLLRREYSVTIRNIKNSVYEQRTNAELRDTSNKLEVH